MFIGCEVERLATRAIHKRRLPGVNECRADLCGPVARSAFGVTDPAADVDHITQPTEAAYRAFDGRGVWWNPGYDHRLFIAPYTAAVAALAFA